MLLAAGFVDTFRLLYPDKRDAYTWWSYMFDARSRNAGWRIDYFLVSERLKEHVREATIYAEVHGSDHCPVGLELSEACRRRGAPALGPGGGPRIQR